MRFRESILVVIGLVCAAVFAWSLTRICSAPLFAHIASWLSPLAFAALGFVWALQAEGYAPRTRVVAAISPIVIGFLAVLIVPPFDFACHQRSASADSVMTEMMRVSTANATDLSDHLIAAC
jgi:hypothetical protein